MCSFFPDTTNIAQVVLLGLNNYPNDIKSTYIVICWTFLSVVLSTQL